MIHGEQFVRLVAIGSYPVGRLPVIQSGVDVVGERLHRERYLIAELASEVDSFERGSDLIVGDEKK